MYGKHECEFRIVRVLDGKFKQQLLKDKVKEYQTNPINWDED